MRSLLLCLVLATLGGCGLFERTSDFDRIAEERPLEIPPDLDRPPSSRMMEVPETAEDPDAEVRSRGDMLLVRDSVESTHRRVGIALERLGTEIVSQSDEDGEFVVNFADERAREERPGLFSRWILRRKGPEDLSGAYRVVVLPEGRESSVSVRTENGGPAPLRVSEELLGALEERLGGA